MNNERELTKNMQSELKRSGIVASYQDYETRKAHLMEINDGFHDVLDFIPDFIMIDLQKEYDYSFMQYSNISEFVEGVLNYKRGIVQQMRCFCEHEIVLP
jgi:hypothetical protein